MLTDLQQHDKIT